MSVEPTSQPHPAHARHASAHPHAAAEPRTFAAPAPSGRVTPDNFARAESDRYFASVVKDGGFGRFHHIREPNPIDHQNVVRLNRDTLYSAAVFDLDAGPVTVTMPDAGRRFMSLQVINEDQYTLGVHYGARAHRLTRSDVGTRYVLCGVRTLADPNDPKDMRDAHALQDTIGVAQASPGRFEIPSWDHASQDKVRAALIELSATLADTTRTFGRREDVDPVRFLIGSAYAWGGNPQSEAMYLNVVPEKNDGATSYQLEVRDVPVDGFWSVSVYDAEGYYEANPQNAYTLNNLTAKTEADGSVRIRFGGCDGGARNCLPIVKGWNYMVRLYRPRAEILDGRWRFPEAEPVG